MSKKNNSKLVNYSFLILILTIGFPFQSIGIPDLDGEFGSDLQIINLLLGNGSVGKSIFNPSTYYEQDYNKYSSRPSIPEAFALEHQYPMVIRNETTEDTQITETKHITKLGLPRHVEDNQGEWVANIFQENEDGIQLESGSLSYWFSKQGCAMSLFDIGRISTTSETVFASNNWVTKVALNGTDDWVDVSQNSLPCVVTTSVSANSVTINSTKSDSLGVHTEIYHYDKYLGMKESAYFTNLDPALDNHKFSFSNILQDVPPNIYFQTPNGTEFYSHYESQFQPRFFGGTATQIPITNVTTTITIDKSDFFNNVNGTDYLIIDTPSFSWIQPTQSPEGETQYRIWEYIFNDPEDFEKLWSITFASNPDFTMDTYIDYANVTSTLPFGNTTTVDPIFNEGSSVDFLRLHIGRTSSGAPNNCNNAAADGSGFQNSISELTQFGASAQTVSTGKTGCNMIILRYDISSIPAEATPIRATLQFNNTAGNCTQGGSFTWCGNNPKDLGWYHCSGEDLRFLPLLDKILAMYKSQSVCGVAADPLVQGIRLFVFNMEVNGAFAHTDTQTDVLFDPFLINFEEILESNPRDNSFQLGSSLAGIAGSGGLGMQYSTAQRGGSVTAIWDPNGSFLEIEWELFSVPEIPQNFTCESQLNDVFLDWQAVINDGGRPVTAYEIERDDGTGFTPLAITALFPTSFTDTTVVAGIGYLYRIAGINGEGTGVFNEFAGNCGLAGGASPVLSLTANNVGVGVVQLNWTPPLFDGNDPITGYKIERTTGSPTAVDNEWTFIQHKQQGGDTVSQGEYRILNIGDSTGFLRLQGFSDTTVEGILMSSNINSGGAGNTYLFRSFLAEDLKNHNVSWRWDQFKKAAGFSLQTFGEWETKAYVVDGVFDMTGANQVGGSGDFPASASGTGNVGIHIPAIGVGLLQDCFNLNNAVVLLGGNPVQATLPNTAQMESANQHEVRCNVGDLSQATQPFVTIVFMIRDQQTSLSSCGSNCASHEIGAIVMDFIDIDGIGNWVFTDDLPLDTDINFDSVSTTLNVFGNTQTKLFTIGEGFVILEPDTGTTLTLFNDDTVEEITFYGYRVSGVNAVGAGTPSDTVIIQTAGSPQVPVITAQPTSTTSINIFWEEPELNLSTVIEYEIKRKVGTGGIFQFLDVTTELEFDDGLGLFKLQPSTEYCYAIKLITNVGDTDFSVDSCATTFSPPDKIENLVVIALDGSSVNMSFDDPLFDGGSPIIGFQIEQKIGAGAFDIVQVSSFNKIRNDTALPIGTLITYRVSASNQFGISATVSAGDTTDATPQVPPNFTCSASSSTSITLNWDTPLTFTAPTGYQIDGRSIGGVFSTIIANTANTDTFFVSGGLPIDTTAEFRILAITPEGNTDFTPTITCSTLGTPDFPPEDLQGDFTTTIPHQMVLAWDIPDTFGIPIIEFRIERDDGAGYNQIATVSSSTFLFIDQDPANSVVQKYRIFTVGSEGDSAPSIAIPFSANQTSHWSYEKTVDDTGDNKNVGAVTGAVNFNNTAQVGVGLLFDGSTYITVDNESDYDHSNNVSFGITTYYRGNSTGVDQVLVSKAGTMSDTGFRIFIDSTGVLGVRLTNTATTNELHVLGSTNVTDNSIHFLGFGYDGNNDESGLSLMVDGSFETKNVIANTLSSGILNARPLVLGANDGGGNKLTGLLDETRFFGSGTLDDATLEAIANNSIDTVIPINATITIGGTTFADISRENPLILMTSGFPLPTIDTITLFNFTATDVNSNTPALIIDGVSGQFVLDPNFFNIMSSLSNYTAVGSLTNSEETFPLLSNFDLQTPIFTFTGDFFFQQQRNDDFTILSFNYTQTDIPFDLSCNFKSKIFDNGTTVNFDGVFFVEHLQEVPQLEDVVVGCIDQNTIVLDPTAPSFGGSNTILSFVSFGDTTGVGNFLQFTNNYGDFFGVGLPFLFVIILAAAFTGRSAPTGILIIAVAIGIMWAMGILEVDPFMWGIILVLVILGILGGKKFL